MVHELSCSEAHGIFPDQRSNLYLLHWQVDSLPLSHQGSPHFIFIIIMFLAALSLPVLHRLLYLQRSGLVAPRHVGS